MSVPGKSHIRRMDELTNEPVLDHEYDGIEELDNPLPGWWLATFYICIAFAGVYFVWQNVLGGAHIHEEAYKAEWASHSAKIATLEKAAEKAIDPKALSAELSDKALVAPGQKVFSDRCVMCHGPGGGGVVGPNLTDNHWLNGDGTPPAIFKIVSKGVDGKGMPNWEGVLKPEEIKQVTAYVLSIRGSHPANAKAPQGKEVK